MIIKYKYFFKDDLYIPTIVKLYALKINLKKFEIDNDKKVVKILNTDHLIDFIIGIKSPRDKFFKESKKFFKTCETFELKYKLLFNRKIELSKSIDIIKEGLHAIYVVFSTEYFAEFVNDWFIIDKQKLLSLLINNNFYISISPDYFYSKVWGAFGWEIYKKSHRFTQTLLKILEKHNINSFCSIKPKGKLFLRLLQDFIKNV